MLVDNARSTREDTLAQTIQRQIHRGTGGRLRKLQVELYPDRVIVHGCSSSYYLIQLVVLAVRAVVPLRAVELDIQVGSAASGRLDDDPL